MKEGLELTGPLQQPEPSVFLTVLPALENKSGVTFTCSRLSTVNVYSF